MMIFWCFEALHNCRMILSERSNYNPRVSVSPFPRVGLNHLSIQQRCFDGVSIPSMYIQ